MFVEKINNVISSLLSHSHGSYPKTIINRKRVEEIMNRIMRIEDIFFHGLH